MQGNRTAIILLGVLIFVGLGYGYYSMMYKPAKAKLGEAQSSRAAAADALEAKTAQQQKTTTVKDDYSKLATTIVSTVAIPRDREELLATQLVANIARRTGVQIAEGGQPSTGGGATAAAAVDPTTGAPVAAAAPSAPSFTVTYKMYGTYDQLTAFVQQVEEPVKILKGKVYVRDRLINIKSFTLETAETGTSGTSSDNGSGTVLRIVKGGLYASIEIELFYDATEVDPLAAGDPAAATGGAVPTDPAAAGATTPAVPTDGTQPSAPAATDPSAQTPSASVS